MTLWFVDASVLLASEDPDDQHHHDAIRLLAGAEPLGSLDLAYYEVSNVAVRAWHDPLADLRLRARVAAVADDGGIVRADAALLSRAVAVADAHGSRCTTPRTWRGPIVLVANSSVAISAIWSRKVWHGSQAMPWERSDPPLRQRTRSRLQPSRR